MDLKKEVKVGDFVEYVDGTGIVRDEDGYPLRVIEIKNHGLLKKICVYYTTGGFDFLDTVQKASPLLLELI